MDTFERSSVEDKRAGGDCLDHPLLDHPLDHPDDDLPAPPKKERLMDQSAFLHHKYRPLDSKYPTNFIKSFSLPQRPIAVSSASQELSHDIIAIQFYENLKIYTIKMNDNAIAKYLLDKESGNDLEVSASDVSKFEEQMVNLRPIHDSGEMPYPINNFAISSKSSYSLPPRKLMYAVTLVEKELTTYFFQLDIERDDLFPTYAFKDPKRIQELKGYNAPISHLSFDDGGNSLAAITQDPVLYIWELRSGNKIGLFQLKSPGVAMAWHKSEPQKIMVIERDGWLKMFNLAKHMQIMSVNMLSNPLLSGDWLYSDSLVAGLGSVNSCFTVDLSKVNSGFNKMVEIKSGNTVAFKFSTNDSKVFATLGKPDNEIKIFHQSFPHQPILSYRQKDIQDFIWIFGKPYILVLMGKEIVLFDARSNI